MLALLAGCSVPALAAHAAGKKHHTSAAPHTHAERAGAERGSTARENEAEPRESRSRHGRHHKVSADDDRTMAQPAILRGGRRGRGRFHRMDLRLSTVALGEGLAGSHDSLVRQNVKVVEDGLERIEDNRQLHDAIARQSLVPVPVSESLNVNSSLPEDRRYCRPWTATFLADLSKAHYTVFHAPLLVSSAVRTVQFQFSLRHHNRNAAPAVGDVASPHLTGATVDIAKSQLSESQREWMRRYLLELQNQGKIDVEEEFRESCFHITVYRSYTGSFPSVFHEEDFLPSRTALSSETPDQGSGMR